MQYEKVTFVDGSSPPINAKFLNSLGSAVEALCKTMTSIGTCDPSSNGSNYIMTVDGQEVVPEIKNGELMSILFVPTANNESPSYITWGGTRYPIYDMTTKNFVEAGELTSGTPAELYFDGTTMWYKGGSRYLKYGISDGEAGLWDRSTEVATAETPIRYNGDIYARKIWCAVWNDYAEFRAADKEIKPGFVVCENGDDTVSISTKRLQPGGMIVSDTFGMAIGADSKFPVPIAVSGRVLAYTDLPVSMFSPGDPVCTGENGTVSLMTRDEVINYPDRMIGTVSAIPNYDSWGTNGEIEVDGRIWIKVR